MEKLCSGWHQGNRVRESGDGSKHKWFATLALVVGNLCGEANFVNGEGTFMELQY